jgi:hypothetical protein
VEIETLQVNSKQKVTDPDQILSLLVPLREVETPPVVVAQLVEVEAPQ